MARPIDQAVDVLGCRAACATPRFQAEHFHHNRGLVRRIEAIASQKGCSPSQLTLAWLLGQGEDVVAIPGTRYPLRLDENIGAMGVQLTAAEIEHIFVCRSEGIGLGYTLPRRRHERAYL